MVIRMRIRKRAVSTVDGVLGEAVGQMYSEKYFPAAAKERMVALVGNLKGALGDRIRELEWMSEGTKEKALEKLSAITVNMGHFMTDNYPYSPVVKSIIRIHVKKRILQDTCRKANLIHRRTIISIHSLGCHIPLGTVYGFNLEDWWTEADAKSFQDRAQKLVTYFDRIEVLPGLHANGKLTLGENIADHGGLQVAYTAFKKAVANQPLPLKEGFTPEQRFFLAYANVWAGNIRDEQIRVLTKADPHSLGRWRVNGALPHINAWYEAFGINKNDPMYLSPEERAVIW